MNEAKVLKENSIYRLSDLIRRKGIRWEQDRHHILTSDRFRGTILYDYLSAMRVEDDKELLQSVVWEHSKRYKLPVEDELVIHLRLGDTMDDSDEFRSRSYEKSMKVYGMFDADLPKSVKRATIVTALHFGANELNNKYFYTNTAHSRSIEVLGALQKALDERGLPWSIQSSSNIDEDFCYMANAKYFVKSYSQMSTLAQQCLSPTALVWAPPKGQLNTKFELI